MQTSQPLQSQTVGWEFLLYKIMPQISRQGFLILIIDHLKKMGLMDYEVEYGRGSGFQEGNFSLPDDFVFDNDPEMDKKLANLSMPIRVEAKPYIIYASFNKEITERDLSFLGKAKIIETEMIVSYNEKIFKYKILFHLDKVVFDLEIT